MKDQIKELRVRIDGLSQLVKELKPIEFFQYNERELKNDIIKINSDEINKTYDSLLLAKAWLGKVLGELGEDTPYKNDGKRKEVKDIEPAADTAKAKQFMSLFKDSMLSYYNRKSHIEKVDWLREEIETINKTFQELITKSSYIATYYINNILTYLSEARFWLGFELGRCRDENNK